MTDRTPRDELLKRILSLADDSAAAAPDEHPDDETLTLFTDGALDQHSQTQLLEHLDRCSPCRQMASALLREQAAERSIGLASGQRIWTHNRVAALALAAALLVAVGVMWWPRTDGHLLAQNQAYDRIQKLLVTRDFAAVRRAVAEAEKEGTGSGRLLSLKAQAAREMPSPLALAQAGRLTDFGYGIDGAMARGVGDVAPGLKSAIETLSTAGNRDLEVLLNRGDALLAAGYSRDALQQFELTTQLAPHNPLAWLGLGLAYFAENKFPQAENAFRRCLEIDRRQISAQFNLAMTLEEESRNDEAIVIWKALLAEPISETDRQEIEKHLRDPGQTTPQKPAGAPPPP